MEEILRHRAEAHARVLRSPDTLPLILGQLRSLDALARAARVSKIWAAAAGVVEQNWRTERLGFLYAVGGDGGGSIERYRPFREGDGFGPTRKWEMIVDPSDDQACEGDSSRLASLNERLYRLGGSKGSRPPVRPRGRSYGTTREVWTRGTTRSIALRFTRLAQASASPVWTARSMRLAGRPGSRRH